MRILSIVCSAIILAVSLIMNTNVVAADLAPAEGGITILGLFGDAVRSDDQKSVSVTESIFFNNSGSDQFYGNFSLWIQQGAYVSSRTCGSQRNNISIVETGPKIRCIPLKVIDSENYKFMPFLAGEFLSYYGEKHTVSLNATTVNGSYQMDFDVTLGMNSVSSVRYAAIGNVNVSTSSYKIGAEAFLTWAPHRNLTIRQTVNLSNTGGNPEEVDLTLLGVPSRWTASLWRGGTSVTSVQIPAGGYVNLVLNVTAPSYILQAYVEYQIQGKDEPSGELSFTITRVLSYNATFVDYRVYAQERDEVTATGKLEIAHGSIWNQTTQRKVYPIYGFNVKRGDVSTIFINWKPPPWEVPMWAIAAAILLFALLLVFLLLKKRGVRMRIRHPVEVKVEEKPAATPPAFSSAELRQRKDTLKKSLERLSQDEKDGTIPKDVLARMQQDIQAELTEVEQNLNALLSATTRKKAILKALRKLEKDYKEGKVDRELYASLKARYEKEAVGILKQIEELRKEGMMNDESEEG